MKLCVCVCVVVSNQNVWVCLKWQFQGQRTFLIECETSFGISFDSIENETIKRELVNFFYNLIFEID